MNIEKELDAADLMVSAQNFTKAISIYNQIIEKNAYCDEAYLMRGALYGELGQIEKAIKDVQTAIDIDPEYEGSYLTLAMLYKSHGEPEKAISSYQRAIDINNNNKEAIQNIVNLHVALADQQLTGHLADKAVENYRYALKYLPDNLHLLYKLAFALSRTGEFKSATAYAEKILRQDAHYLPAMNLLCSVYEKISEVEKGWEMAQSMAEQHPDNAAVIIVYGKYALRQKQQDLAISKLKNILSKGNLKGEEYLSINMLLGKLYDSINEYEHAFSYFKKANSLKYNDYDVNEFKNNVSLITSFFSKERYHEIPTSENDSGEVIFILGMPRSGSSLIEQILSSHSKVYAAGELPHINNIALTIDQPGGQYPTALERISVSELNHYADDLLTTLRSMSSESSNITDKLPHNFLFIGLIHKLLPQAKIINCLRDPIDTCLSCYFQHFGGHHPYAYDLSNLAVYYQQYLKLMSHWRDELKIPILNIQYEDVVNDTKSEVERMLSFVGLDWEDNCLEFYKQKRSVHTASYAQVSEKIYNKSVKRWKNYESYIAELTDRLI